MVEHFPLNAKSWVQKPSLYFISRDKQLTTLLVWFLNFFFFVIGNLKKKKKKLLPKPEQKNLFFPRQKVPIFSAKTTFIFFSKTVVNQVQELQVILNEIHVKGMMLSKTFQVATIIEKLPPNWKDFKNYLKHKKKEMSIKDLIIRLHIEEDNRGSEKKEAHNPSEAKANFVEHGQGSKFKKANNKGKCSKLGPKGGITKKQKFQGKCFNCEKQGHKSLNWRLPKPNIPKEANVVDGITKDVYEVNLVESNPKEWWIDTSATCHVCLDKKMFSTFEPNETW